MPRNTTCYSIAGTKFYRLSSKALFNQFGTNLQNIEKSIRKLYWSDTGYKLCQVDQSGAEALIVAYLCKKGRFRSLFENGIKPHVYVALILFKEQWKQKINEHNLDIKCDIDKLCETPIPELQLNPFWKDVDYLIKSSDDWVASERYYYIAKQVCHSSNYGIEAGMFCLNTLEKSRGKIVIKKKEGEKFLSTYHSLFPEIREWHLLIEYLVKENRVLYNLLGYPIYFTDALDTKSSLKEAFSCIPQSTVACITRQAATNLQNLIETANLDWDILQDNHDSLCSQCPESEDIICCKTMQEFFEIEMIAPSDKTKFKMKSEATSGYNWAPYNDINNPFGLQKIK